MQTVTLDEARGAGRQILAGERIAFKDLGGRVRIGTVRIREVRCGKKNCKKCPHKIYAYAQYRVGKKVTEKYIGVARGVN
ncbi:unnamed protein product [marine sediment metagenome]|uniref:DUF6788 domain-containing protein n=1 Tax=marine sediment metagenome TaxID=412755 RepID=X1H1P8_9ZZZZ